MSTKTTFKRIALVAVAALGLGVLTSVAPASATNAITPTAIAVGTIPAAQVGVVNTTPITVTAPFASTVDTFTVNVRVTSAPVGSAYRGVAGASKLVDGTSAGTFVAATFAAGNSVGALISITAAASSPTATVGSSTLSTANGQTVGVLATSANFVAQTTAGFRVNITPDVAGAYTVLVSTRAYDGTLLVNPYSAGDANTSYTFSTGNAVASMVLAAKTTTGGTTDSVNGQLMSLTLKDSAGAVTSLAPNETVAITASGTTEKLQKVTVTAGAYVANTSNGATANAALTLSNADFLNGIAYFNYADTTASTAAVITATGSGLLSSAISSTLTTTVKSSATGTAVAGANFTLSDNAALTMPAAGTTAYVTGTPGTAKSSLGATTRSFTATFTSASTATLLADTVFNVKVTDTSGKVTGIIGQVYDKAMTCAYDATLTAATQVCNLVVEGTLSVATNSIRMDVGTASVTADDGVIVTSEAAVATTNTISPATTIRQNHGASTGLSAVLKDQFGAVMINQPVTVVTSGRNATASAANGVTDAAGRTTYTRTDAGTAATVSTADVVTITSGGIAASAVTINYSATSPASTITCLTGNEDDTAATITYRDIDASSLAGVSTGALSLCTITIKDVNGSIVTGIPVTVTTASAGAAVRSNSALSYTGSLGTVAPVVYGWTAGTKTFTITAGAVTKDVTVNYRQGGPVGTNAPLEVRTISAVRTGNSIVVTATDRLGNLVQGVALYASRTGNGLFGGGSNTNSQTTDRNGSAEFIFNAGSADSVVTITAGSLTEAAVAYGQTSSKAGELCVGVDCTGAAFTATTVGTATTAETGVGASFAPAGIGSVAVPVPADTSAADAVQAAADAAAEAIDAGNNANDSAVAATEAAEAAAAAAEEAGERAVAAAEAASAAAVEAAQAATDAANEALDAANAATDAANASAEAADAATAAAQDAADAVAALSTQVSEMINALKKQITSLTNLVIKIQKKVKA